MSPFQALYCVPPLTVQTYMQGTTVIHSVDKALQDCDTLLRLLHANLQLAQNRMKQTYDKGRTEREFKVGEWVYLKLQLYRQQSVTTWQFNKLTPKFYGPFQVKARIDSIAYHLILPHDSKIHHVFHVSLLKKKIGDDIAPNPTLPPIDFIGYLHWQPEKILDRGMFKHKNTAVTKWLGLFNGRVFQSKMQLGR
ncbi:hypothetical protein FF2_029171 [Malus domestica]